MLYRDMDRKSGAFEAGTSPIWIAAAAIAVLLCLRWPIVLAAICGFAVIATVLWGARYTRHHVKWLVLPLLLNEALASVSAIDDSIRPVLRYSLLALFCIPFLPNAFKSGLLKQGGFRLYVIYFIWGGITVIYSIYPFYSLGRVSSAALLLTAIVAVTEKIDSDEAIYDLIKIFWIGSAIIMAVLAASVALPSDMTWKIDDNGMFRFAGIFNSPNQIGELMLTTVASGAMWWPAASKRMRWLIAASIALAITFDVMADSRSPFIALSIGLFLVAITRYGFRAIATASALLIVGFVVFHLLEGSRDYVTRGDVSSLTGRTEIWKYVVHTIKERPLTGWGFEVEGEIFQNRYFPLWEQIWNEGPRSSLHNGYFSRAIGVGIPAALLWIFLSVRSLGFAIFNRSATKVLRNAALIAAVPVLILNMVESTAGDCRYSVGLLMAIVWSLSEKARLGHIAATKGGVRDRLLIPQDQPIVKRRLQAV